MHLYLCSHSQCFTKEGCHLENIQNVIFKASDGDHSSFGLLIQEFDSRLTAIARYYVQDEAKDIIQQVWLKIWKKREHLRGVQNMEAWLFQVTRHQCFEYSRNKSMKNKRITSVSFDENYEILEKLITNEDGPETTIFRKETSEALKNYVSQLKEIFALPISLYYFEGLSVQEISQHLNLTVSTVKWRLYSGRQLLKKIILKGGFLNDQKAGCQYVKRD